MLQIAIAYGGVQQALLHSFHSMQQEFMIHPISLDNVSLILLFHHIHQLLLPLTKNPIPLPPHLNAPAFFLSANQRPQVFHQYLPLKWRHMLSKH